MPRKPVARLGDPGNHGGTIVSGSATITVNNLPMALVGDIYDCPEHGKNPIITGTAGVLGNNVLIAHVGSMTACGAMITSGSPDTFIDTPTKGVSSDSNIDNKEKYDEKVRVFDKDGKAIVNMPFYIITEEGKTYKGFTDNEGCCPRIYTPTIQSITIFLGVEALEKWEQ